MAAETKNMQFKRPNVVSYDEWFNARHDFLEQEKEITAKLTELAKKREQLPWCLVEKEYRFETTGQEGIPRKQKGESKSSSGAQQQQQQQQKQAASASLQQQKQPQQQHQCTLSDLFHGKHQLIVYHFMFPPDAKRPHKLCAFFADQFSGPVLTHLRQKDCEFVCVSRAPLDKLKQAKERFHWEFEWCSSGDSDFNYDFNASFTDEQIKRGKAVYNFEKQDPHDKDREGVSVFYKDDDGKIYHTYSCYERGIDILNVTYSLLDLTPKGRDEDPTNKQKWIRLRDRYESTSSVSSREREEEEQEEHEKQKGGKHEQKSSIGGRQQEQAKQELPAQSESGAIPTNTPVKGT